jgi:hypothetical protein
MKLRNIAVVASVGLACAGVSAAAAYPSAAVATTVHVTAKDFACSPQDGPPGRDVRDQNAGSSSHDSRSQAQLEDDRSGNRPIDGEAQAGALPYKCAVDSTPSLA